MVLKSSASASDAERSGKIASVVAQSFTCGAFCLFCSPHGNDKIDFKRSRSGARRSRLAANGIVCDTSLLARKSRVGAVSSVVEHLVYTERVGGSKPSPPIFQRQIQNPNIEIRNKNQISKYKIRSERFDIPSLGYLNLFRISSFDIRI